MRLISQDDEDDDMFKSVYATLPPSEQQQISQNMEESEFFMDPEDKELLESTLGTNMVDYMKDLMLRSNATPPKFDVTYGIRYIDKVPYIGAVPITVNDDKLRLPDGSEYQLSRGLWNLLVLDEPTS